MNEWYQLWSKGGANPNYVVSDRANYISGFNWLSNWINIYFFQQSSRFYFRSYFFNSNSFYYFFHKKI